MEDVRPPAGNISPAVASTYDVRFLLRAISHAAQADSDSTAEDLDRLNGILDDAVATLSKSFEDLARLTNRQKKSMDFLVSKLMSATDDGGDLDFEGFLGYVVNMIHEFTNLLGHFSKESVSISFFVEDLIAEMDRVFVLLGRVNDIAEDTNILAINAALEAARAGELGKGFGVVSNEVRILSKNTKELNSSITERINVARRLINQLETALSRMASHDLQQLVSASHEMSGMMEKVRGLDTMLKESVQQSNSYTQAVHTTSNDILRAIQFHDLCGQLIQAVADRVQLFPQTVREAAESMPTSVDDLPSYLRSVADAIENEARSAREGAHMPTQQTSIDAGEVVMF